MVIHNLNDGGDPHFSTRALLNAEKFRARCLKMAKCSHNIGKSIWENDVMNS